MTPAILAAAYRYGAYRGALDEQNHQPWKDTIPLTRASVDAILAHGDPKLRGIRRGLFRRRHQLAIQAEVNRAYRFARYMWVTQPIQGTVLHIVRGSSATKFQRHGA